MVNPKLRLYKAKSDFYFFAYSMEKQNTKLKFAENMGLPLHYFISSLSPIILQTKQANGIGTKEGTPQQYCAVHAKQLLIVNVCWSAL